MRPPRGITSRPGLILLVCSLLAGCGFCGTSDIEGGQTEFVTTVPQGFVSSYVLDVGQGRVVLVDAGSDEDAAEVHAELEAQGVETRDIAAILITHGHGDHVAGLPSFPPEIPRYAHRADHQLIAKESEGHADRALEHRQRLTFGERTFTFYHLPGHTPGSVAILVDGVLFLGDSAVATDDGELRLAPNIFTEDPEQNRESLAELLSWLQRQGVQVDWMLMSHSGPLEGTGALERFVQDG